MDSGGDKLKRENAAQKVKISQTDRFKKMKQHSWLSPPFCARQHQTFFFHFFFQVCVVQKDIETTPLSGRGSSNFLFC